MIKLLWVSVMLVVPLFSSDALAQHTSLRERMLGTWHFVIAEITAPNGKKSFPFGPTPRGILIFTPEGDFVQTHIASEVPKIASGNRLAATGEEYAGIVRGSIALFGTYTVDEEKRTVVYHIVSSTFQNWEGISQIRLVEMPTDDELRHTNPDVGAGRGSATNIYKRRR
jgi:hypothetical protein